MRKVRSNHNSLLNYFLYDKRDLSPAYVRKCEEFIDSLGSAKLADCFKMEKPQASSSKHQAPSSPAGTTSGCKKIKKDLTSFKQPGTVG